MNGSKRPDDAFFIPLWSPYKPKDFYFAAVWETKLNTTVVYIVPCDYYNTTGKRYNESMPIIQYLPTYLEEVSEAEYETSCPISMVEHDMLYAGFVRSSNFLRYITGPGRFGL